MMLDIEDFSQFDILFEIIKYKIFSIFSERVKINHST